MMQPAQLWDRDGPSFLGRLHWSRLGGILVQAQVGPGPVVVGEIGFEQTVQVSLVEDE